MTIEELLDRCKDAYERNDFTKAIGICDEILKKDSANQVALGYKARCLHLLGENDEALEILDDAIISYPKNYRYLDIKAEVLMDKGEYGGAIECFDEIFSIGVCDETVLDFIRMDYETCISLNIDRLIDNEKYVEAWKWYEMLEAMKSPDLKRPQMIDRFKRHVRGRTTRPKFRHYHVRPSSDEAKSKLISFLKQNGFKGDDEAVIFSIDVIEKSFNAIPTDEECGDAISESKFYDKVNYYPRGRIMRKRIFSEDGVLLYEGHTLHNAPYGFGTAYFQNGNVYREGIFDIKGIVQGREYYPSGQLRFEGQWSLTTGYGPNAPYNGNAYSEDGELIYSGKFEIIRSGVGWPRIQKPKGFALEQKERPKIEYY